MDAFQKYQKQLKKWQSMTRAQAEKSIARYYRTLIRDTLGKVGEIYEKFEKDGMLSYEEMAKYDRITSFLESLKSHINQTSKQTQESIERALSESYAYSYEWMAFSIESATQTALGVTTVQPDVVQKAIDNPVRGLTLSETLEKNRVDIVYKIQQNVKRGLTQGMTYKQMADELKTHLGNDGDKALRIVRTELHRVNEQAEHEIMERANKKGIISTKEWNCSLDERVRRKRKANHRALHGQKVPIAQDFDLGSGKRGNAPGNTGHPEHDINCRCFLVYDVTAIEGRTSEELANITFEDWQAMNRQ
ncbi:phage minor head protein [Solibacillus isronensis]|uniref:phage minor head protein n=1 Tax=Solibacillus isronensis TaxID=412383 RepID=UPI0039A34B19